MGDTIGSKSFEFYLENYKPYINGVVKQAYKNNNFLDHDEVFQELSILAWKCYEKYKTKPIEDYIKILKVSICNTMANIANKQRRDRRVCFPLSSLEDKFGQEFFEKQIEDTDSRTNFGSMYEQIEKLTKELSGHKYVTKEVKKKMNKLTEDMIL
jgi:hypothetical protein